METQTTTGALADPVPNSIAFSSFEEGGETLRIAPDGFYVRGQKLPQDAEEARKVYDAFAAWLRAAGHAA